MNSKRMSFESRLIAEVKKYECLYNLKSLNYKDIAFKDKLWQKVAQALRSNVDECKRKWKHLRDCYNRLKKRELSRKKGHGIPSGRKVWRFKADMDFLEQFTFTKRALNQQDDSDDNSDDYFTPLPPLPTKTEEVHDECEKVEEMYTEHEKLEPDDSKEFESIMDTTALEVETMYQDVFEQEEAVLPHATKMHASNPTTNEDSTTLMFKLLDRKIKQAPLTEEQISDLETSVMLFVYKKLREYK